MKGDGKKKVPCIIFLLAVAGIFINITLQNNSVPAEEKGYTESNKKEIQGQNPDNEEGEERNQGAEEKPEITITISDHYITNTGNPSNLYYIDDQRVLWGCGKNEYGQLGQGTQDHNYYETMVKIAENVIHVDYSQRGFVIFLTEDNKLYGFGNAGEGALRQLSTYSGEERWNGEHYAVMEPVLLMEEVVYARCGQSDIVAIRSDASVWIWGVIWYQEFWNQNFYYQEEPMKVLDNAVLVTGGFFNHAALLEDGSLWTWGYNYAGNCGIAEKPVISLPQKAAEEVSMVWTGGLGYNVDCFDITEFDGGYERALENTIIRKTDGSYWICGINVGNEEKVLPVYHEVVDYSVIFTHEFLPYDMK